MNYITFIEEFKKGLKNIETDGFIIREIDRNVYFEKSYKDGVCISINWTEYDNLHVSGLSVKKRFNEVESIISDLFGGEINNYYTIHCHPNSEMIPEGLEYTCTENNIHFVIKNKIDLSLYIRFFQEFYETAAKGFLVEYKNIDTVNQKLQELLNQRKIQTLITDSGGNNSIIRFYLIALKHKNSTIEEFFENTYFPYLQENKENPINSTELEMFRKIKTMKI